MVSPELLRRYPFFAGFTPEQLTTIAMAAEELEVPGGHRFCNEGDELNHLYLVLEGSVEITLTLPEKGSRSVLPPPAGQAREISLSVARPSELFAWSALVPPYQATSNVVAAEESRVVAFDAAALRQRFDSDPAFGYQLLVRVAQIARDRIQDLHLEALASVAG